jgi:hypothetical protein
MTTVPDPRREPGKALLERRLRDLARLEGAAPIDPGLPDRVLAALGLALDPAPPARPPSRRSRRTLVLAAAAALALLLLLPARPTGRAQWAAAPGVPAERAR